MPEVADRATKGFVQFTEVVEAAVQQDVEVVEVTKEVVEVTTEVVRPNDVEVVAKEEPPKSPPPKHSDKVKKKLEEEEAEVDARVANQKMALHERLRNPIARANAQGDGAGLCRCMSMNKLLWLRGKETRKQSYCLVGGGDEFWGNKCQRVLF